MGFHIEAGSQQHMHIKNACAMTIKIENWRNIFHCNSDFSFCIKDEVLRSSANLFYKHIPIKYIYFEIQRDKLEGLRSMKQSKVLSSFWLLKLFRLL